MSNLDKIATVKAINPNEGINGYVLNFAHGGLQRGDMDSLDSLVMKVVRKNTPLKLIDVGVAKGSSSAVMAYRAREFGGVVHGVDDYAPHKNFIDLYWQNMRYLGLNKHVDLIIERSEVAYARFEDESIDLVFLDASHHYPDVVRDIKVWYPKIRKGGILCGHDCQILSKDGKVDIRPWQDVASNTVGYDQQDFAWHVGVIIAVGDTLENPQHLPPNVWWQQK